MRRSYSDTLPWWWPCPKPVGGEMTPNDPPLMSCPECGALLEVHQDSGRIVCPHCRYEEGSG